jgi:hypothetical protein
MTIQDYIEYLFNISHDASATLIITLATFLVGYLITATVYIVNKYLERSSNRKIFLDNLRDLTKSVRRQHKGLIDTINSLDIRANTTWEYSKIDFFQIPVFHEMSYKECFKSFFLGVENQMNIFSSRKLKRHAFTKVWENLNNVQYWSERGLDDFRQYLEAYNQYGERRNHSLNELRIMWEDLFQTAQMNPKKLANIEIEYAHHLDKIVSSYQKIPTKKRVGPFTTNRSLILPIRILNKKYHLLPLARTINDKAMEVGTYYNEMEVLLRNLRVQYRIYASAFRSIQKTNEKIIKILG